MSLYHGDWTDYESLKDSYPNAPPEESIIYACYTYENYDGSALVVFADGGRLFENNDSHCSCYGLDKWEPEETWLAALRMRTDWHGLQEQLDRIDPNFHRDTDIS